MGALVHPEVEIHTERTVHRGREAAMEWSAKGFDHIYRRYVPLEIEPVPGGVRVAAELQYVWRESDEVGDTSAVTIELGLRDGLDLLLGADRGRRADRDLAVGVWG